MRIVFIFFVFLFAQTHFLFAQDKGSATLLKDKETIARAEIISIQESKEKEVPNTDTRAVYVTTKIRFIEGENKGKMIEITDTAFPVKSGDTVYVRHTITADGTEYFSIFEVDRSSGLLWLFFFFFVAVLVLGGKQGFLSLLSLFISFGVIFKILFPTILTGGNVVFIATVGALLSLFVVMFVTHGFSRLTVSAYLGCFLSVIVTLCIALYAVKVTMLTGFATEESVFLNLATKGGLDFVALLIGGIIIGVIGVIDDIAITQASVVGELKRASSTLSRRELYLRAMKVGKDHMGAVINTLVLAYAGASLPLVLLLYVSDQPFVQMVNSEVIATEIVRTLTGSFGLLAAVPLTTLIAVFLMKEKEGGASLPGAHHHHH